MGRCSAGKLPIVSMARFLNAWTDALVDCADDKMLTECMGTTTPGLALSTCLEFSKRQSERSKQMPAKSKAQQMAAGAALAAKRGEKKKSELKGASKSMEKSMSEKELDKMASTNQKGKAQHKKS